MVRRAKRARHYKSGFDLENVGDENVRMLCAAICLRAVRDYKRALDGIDYAGNSVDMILHECKDFFDSPVFRSFVRTNPEETCRIIANFEGDIPQTSTHHLAE